MIQNKQHVIRISNNKKEITIQRYLHLTRFYIYIYIYRVSRFKSCTKIFLQRSIFRKNVLDKSCLSQRGDVRRYH